MKKIHFLFVLLLSLNASAYTIYPPSLETRYWAIDYVYAADILEDHESMLDVCDSFLNEDSEITRDIRAEYSHIDLACSVIVESDWSQW